MLQLQLVLLHVVYVNAMFMCKHVRVQWQIIPLITKAVEQFKSHRSERMITFLKMLLAEEYYHVKNYDNSLV